MGDHTGRFIGGKDIIVFKEDGDILFLCIFRSTRTECFLVFSGKCSRNGFRIIDAERKNIACEKSTVHPACSAVDPKSFRTVFDAADLMHGKMQFLTEKLLDRTAGQMLRNDKLKSISGISHLSVSGCPGPEPLRAAEYAPADHSDAAGGNAGAQAECVFKGAYDR